MFSPPSPLVSPHRLSPATAPHFLLFYPLLQVSAKSGENVETAFMTVVKAAAARVKDEEPIIPEALKLDASPKPPSSGCAC